MYAVYRMWWVGARAWSRSAATAANQIRTCRLTELMEEPTLVMVTAQPLSPERAAALLVQSIDTSDPSPAFTQ